MIQRVVLFIAVFLIILLALSFGETIFSGFFSWISWISGKAILNFSQLYHHIAAYTQANTLKVIIAIALTLPISYWIGRRHHDDTRHFLSKRKVSIFLAISLGWIGIHRFYVGQYAAGLVYVILFYIFAPISVLLALIDAVRYFTMSDDEFLLRFR